MTDFWLARFGKSALFKAELPRGVTLGYDKFEGYKFLEEGVIHIVDEHAIYGRDTLAAILAYDFNESDVFVKARSSSWTGFTTFVNSLGGTSVPMIITFMTASSR